MILYYAAAGLTTISDAFVNANSKPVLVAGQSAVFDGLAVIHRDTNTGYTYFSVRTGGAWHVMSGPVA